MDGTDHDILVALHTNVNNLSSMVEKNLKDHETRLRTLEAARYKIMGISAAAGFVSSIIAFLGLGFKR